jgi:hypothetical protein
MADFGEMIENNKWKQGRSKFQWLWLSGGLSEKCTSRSRYGRVYRQTITDVVGNKFDDVRRQDRVGKCTSANPYREKVTGKELSEAPASGECTSGSRYSRVYRQPIADVGNKFADAEYRIGKVWCMLES